MNFYTLRHAKFRNIHENLCTTHLHGFKNKATAPVIFFKYNQEDVTLYNILYYCQCSTCFGWFLRPSSGAQNCTHSIWYMSSLLAATASGSGKQA
jgi:hypothetical protein